MTSSMGGRYHQELAAHKETLLGPRRPRPHKIWRKKFIKVCYADVVTITHAESPKGRSGRLHTHVLPDNWFQ